jgi:hypothetical protein
MVYRDLLVRGVHGRIDNDLFTFMYDFLDDDWATGSWQQPDFIHADDSIWAASQSSLDAFDSLIPAGEPRPIICHRRTASDPRSALDLLPMGYHIQSMPRQHNHPDWRIEFQCACQNPLLACNPRELGFLPLLWPDRLRTFGDLVENFFRKKTSGDARFLHKLFNAIKLSEFDPSYFRLVGVAWVTDRVLKVDKHRFAALLGIRVIDGSLFHKQGNFPSHGFAEIAPDQARTSLNPEALDGVDFDSVRLFVHESNNFFRGCRLDLLIKCKWINSRKNEKEGKQQEQEATVA